MQPENHKNHNRILSTILFTIFIDMLGVGILIPVIPLLLADPTSTEYLLTGTSFTVNQGYILLGMLSAIFPIMQFMSAPVLGRLSDKYGRKPILIISNIGTGLSYVLFVFGIIFKSLPLLFAARALDGITGGNISVAQAAIADITAPQNRAKTFGLIGATFGLGFIIGPFLGGKLSDPALSHFFNAQTPFIFAAILSAINVLMIFLILKETIPAKNKLIKISFFTPFKNIYKAATTPHIRSILSSNFLLQGGFTFFTTFSSVYLINKFGFNQGEIGNYFAFVGLCIVISQAFILRLITKKFKEIQILRFSLFGLAFFILMNLLATHVWQLLIVVPLFATCSGLSQANIASLISRSAGPELQGEILGINASVSSLAMAIPPILAGYISAAISPNAPILTASIVIFFAWISFMLGFGKRKVVHKEWTEA